MPFFANLQNSLLRLLGHQKSALPPFNHKTNPYRSKRTWPPQLVSLTPAQQFRFERKFKRRLTTKSIRPKWNNGVRVATWSIIGSFTVYTVWFYDHRKDPWNPQPGEQPFEGIRRWTRDYFKGVFGDVWTYTGSLNDEVRVEGRDRPMGWTAGQINGMGNTDGEHGVWEKEGGRSSSREGLGLFERVEEKMGLSKDTENRAKRREGGGVMDK